VHGITTSVQCDPQPCCHWCRVLQRWLAAGVLDDPHAEFMVTEQQVGCNNVQLHIMAKCKRDTLCFPSRAVRHTASPNFKGDCVEEGLG
jgi:hypothetical protein